MAYKIGDKFVIEIDSVMTNKNGTLYGIKGFKSLVFDEYGLEQLEKIPSKFEYCVGDEVCSTQGHLRKGVISNVTDYGIVVFWRDGTAEFFLSPSGKGNYTGLRKTGFVDHNIIEWVSES